MSTKPSIVARGKGYAVLVRESEKLLEMMIAVDPITGARCVTADALETILQNADDPEHLEDPLAQALYRFVVTKGASIVLPDGDTEEHDA